MKKIAFALCVLFLGCEVNGLDTIHIDNDYIDTHATGTEFELNTDKKVELVDLADRIDMNFKIVCADFHSDVPLVGNSIEIKANNGNIFNNGQFVAVNGAAILNASDSMINAGIIKAYDGISIFSHDLFSIGLMQSEAKDIILMTDNTFWEIGGIKKVPEGNYIVGYYSKRYKMLRYPDICGDMSAPNTFEMISPEDIAANTHEGVCNIVTNKNVFIAERLFDSNLAVNITCKGFINAAHLECSSMTVSSTDGDLINAGTIETKAGGLDLRTTETLVSSSYMNSFGDMNLDANRFFGFGVVHSMQDINLHTNDSTFSFGIKMKSEKNISIRSDKNIYNGPVLIFNS